MTCTNGRCRFTRPLANGATPPAEKRVADGTVDRSKFYIATKVNPSCIGSEHPTRKGKAHGYDAEIVNWQGTFSTSHCPENDQKVGATVRFSFVRSSRRALTLRRASSV